MSFQALIQKNFVPGSTLSSELSKLASFGDVDVIRRQRSTVFTIKLANYGSSDIIITSFEKYQTINQYYSGGWAIMGKPGEQDRNWGFNYSYKIFINETNPFTLKAGTPDKPTIVDFADIFYDGSGLEQKELHIDYGVLFRFNTDDPTQTDIVDNTSIAKNEVILEAHPVGIRWEPKTKLTYSKNVHGYLTTPKIKDIGVWRKYAESRISDTLVNFGVSSIGRVKISDFLNQNDFLNNKKFDDTFPEMKRVLNRFKDPLPPYDFIWPYGDRYAYNGARKTYDYIPNSRTENFYRNLQIIFTNTNSRNKLGYHQFMERRQIPGVDPSLLKEYNSITGKYVARQRREWGFREKVLKGFPYYIPKNIQSNILGEGTVFGSCSTGPIIAGFVTAGSGIFSGISPSVEINYDYLESQRTVRSSTDTPYGNPRVPNGLIFIQDETGAIGFSIGTDMRYMDSPITHDTNFAEPSTGGDKMHLGSYGLPKPDYRQFLREGDLVIIQVGVGFKYWHPVLGAEPKHWESIYSFQEAANQTVFTRVNYDTQRVIMDDPDIDKLECSCVPGISPKDCVSVRDLLDEYNKLDPIYPCENMEVGKQKVVTFISSNGRKRRSFLFTKYSDGSCECRKFYPGSEPESECHVYSQYQEQTIIGNASTGGQALSGLSQRTPYEPGSLIFNDDVNYFDGENFICDIKRVITIDINPIDYNGNDITNKLNKLSPGSIIKITGSDLELFEFEIVSIVTFNGSIRLNVKLVSYTDDGLDCGPYLICLDEKTGNLDEIDQNSKSEIFETISDYVWQPLGSPRTRNFSNIRPYIDNWGGYTNPKINQGKEAALNIPETPIYALPPFPLTFGHNDQPNIFDAGFPEDDDLQQNIRLQLESMIGYTSNAINIITNLLEGLLKVPPKYPDPIMLIVGVVLSVGAAELTRQIYNRNRHILPSRTKRDSQAPYTEFYPIQQDHPWSTGTPIPVNSGMEYIMADVFSVDNRERFAPPPLEITCAELRGIPEETHLYDPTDEWKIPKLYQDLIEQNDIIIDSQNQFDEFLTPRNLPSAPGTITEPSTAYTRNPGSKYKGQLVKLKNVRFVEPPFRKYMVPKAATIDEITQFKSEYEKTLSDLENKLQKDPFYRISNFEIDLSNSPFSNQSINYSDIAIANREFISILNSTINLVQSVLNVFGESINDSLRSGPQVGPPTQGEATPINYSAYANDFLTMIREITDKMERHATIVEQIQRTNKISGFTNQNEIIRFLALKNQIDLTGFQMRVNHNREIISLIFSMVGGEIDLPRILTNYAVTVLQRVIGGDIGIALQTLHTAWNNMYITEVHEVNEYSKGPVGPSLEFEEVLFPADFPWTVDKNDGGYWWTYPDIPLTNARSHQNDQNHGNPDNTTDNDDGLFILARNQDGGFSFINNPDPNARRHVFSQLVSSNKANLEVPMFDLYNETTLIDAFSGDQYEVEYGKNLHRYRLDYIKARYVKDLGSEFSSSYMPFAEEWKPYRWERDSDGGIIKNEFRPIKAGTRFFGDRIYYVVDDKNVVVPIRINANTEIARYYPLVPTVPVDIIGIAWQYSGGKPGLEWERERYMMQVWPRYFSDVGLKWTPPKLEDLPEYEGPREPDTPVVPPETPDTSTPPRRLPDLTLDIGDAGNPARLDCESVRRILDSQNAFKEQFQQMASWPVVGTLNDTNTHRDPVSGRQINLPADPVRLKEMLDGMPDYPCKGMKVGEQRVVTITSQQFSGVTRSFFFMVGPNGECMCTMFQPGTQTNTNQITSVTDTRSGGNMNVGTTNRRILG